MIFMTDEILEITEFLDQMVHDGTKYTASEIYWKLQVDHKQLTGEFYLIGETKDICDAIYEEFSKARKELCK